MPTVVSLVKAMVFPVVIYGCESWTIKKAERWRIDVFELCCWKRLLRVPWTARRSNQFILKEISPEYSLEGLMLKVKVQYSGHLMERTYSFEKTLMLGKIEGRRRRGWQRMRWLDGTTDSMDMTSSKFLELVLGRKPGVLQSMWLQRVRHDWVTELNWTLMAQWLRICLQMQELWVRSLVWGDPQEKEMAIHSSILAREIPWTEEPEGLQSTGLQKHCHDLATNSNMRKHK